MKLSKERLNKDFDIVNMKIDEVTNMLISNNAECIFWYDAIKYIAEHSKELTREEDSAFAHVLYDSTGKLEW